MIRRPFLFVARTSVLVTGLLSLNGCILLVDESGPSRGVPLSQAMEASANGGGHVSGGGSSGSGTYFDAGAGVESSGGGGGGGGGELMVDYGKDAYSWQIPVEAGYEVPLNGEIESLTRFSFAPVTMEDDHHFISLFLAGDIVDLQPGSLPAAAVNDIWMWEIGFAYRYYLTPAHSFISPYLSANVSFQQMVWDYRNPVFVGSDKITWDSLDGAGGYVGVGIAIKRNSYLSIFGEAGFGGTVFIDKTNQGFDNDVFSNFGYFTVRAGVSIKF